MRDVSGTPLPPGDVRYLSFQGGGAKGAAYWGALAAFAEPNVGIFKQKSPYDFTPSWKDDYVLNTDQVKGVAGASAGAITATLVACGFSLREIYDFIIGRSKYGSMSSFYDEAVTGKGEREVPKLTVGQTNRSQPDKGCAVLPMPGLISSTQDKELDTLTKVLLGIVAAAPVAPAIFLRSLAAAGVYVLVPSVMESVLSGAPPALANKMKGDLNNYLKNVILDHGAFSGGIARLTFDKMIGDKLAERTGQPPKYGLTFDEFSSMLASKHADVDLRLTGTNLTTGRSVVFSTKTTGSFKVVDAVRISMSFPGAFKPVVINRGDVSDDSLAGVWIDGGLLNNNPIHAFDDPPPMINPRLLGLRLSSYPVVDTKGVKDLKYKNVAKFAGAMFSAVFSLSDLGQVRTPQEEAQTIVLKPGKLDTLDFEPSREVLNAAIYDAHDRVLDYFGSFFASHRVADEITGGRLPFQRPPIR